MKQRSVPVVIIAGLLTFGIYTLIWVVMTRNELKAKGHEIPHPLLVLIPFVGGLIYIYVLWKYGEAVEKVTNGKYTGVVAFLMLFLIGFIGAGLIQGAYNELGEGGGSSADPFAGNA